MSLFDRVFDALKSQVEMRGDINRTNARLDSLGGRLDGQDTTLFDHEKRLIRIEALIDLTRGGSAFGRPRLPPD